jgi:hypothetical protein
MFYLQNLILMKDRLQLLEKNDGVLKVLIRKCLNNKEVFECVINHITMPDQNETLKFVKVELIMKNLEK